MDYDAPLIVETRRALTKFVYQAARELPDILEEEKLDLKELDKNYKLL